MFLGYSSMGGNNISIVSPTHLGEITDVKIQNAIYDELFLTKDTTLTAEDDIPTVWDYDTRLHANYQGNAEGGNVNFGLDNTTDLLIKRRVKGTLDWITLYHKSVTSVDDFVIVIEDRFGKNETYYEYALVPVNETVENVYNIVECYSEFNGNYLIDKDNVYDCTLDFEMDLQKNRPRVINTPLNSTSPTYIYTSKQNYISGTVKMLALNSVDGEYDELENGNDYRETFIDALSSGNSMILKTFTGKIHLIHPNDAVLESQEDHWNAPSTSFSFNEIGEINNKNLYNAGLLDVEEEWWVI